MNRRMLLCIGLLCTSPSLQAAEGRFFRQPDINGERIAFCYEGDLWTDPASVMAGKDPQLDRAIEVVLRQIADLPFSFPPVPPYPKK